MNELKPRIPLPMTSFPVTNAQCSATNAPTGLATVVARCDRDSGPPAPDIVAPEEESRSFRKGLDICLVPHPTAFDAALNGVVARLKSPSKGVSTGVGPTLCDDVPRTQKTAQAPTKSNRTLGATLADCRLRLWGPGNNNILCLFFFYS
mmetsp:Transcript_28457/g.46301  ORF Transcript_28457/g.46301 Transcript_28457/m.46301 type:complete len:149 (+) Transcript_28457:747-1193(+)